jgi:hypothetical protein
MDTAAEPLFVEAAGIRADSCVLDTSSFPFFPTFNWFCTFPAAPAPVRGDFVVEDIVVDDAFTFTGVNAEGGPGGADFCNVQFPDTVTVASGSRSDLIFGRIFEDGLTQAAGFSDQVLAELGFGPPNIDPSTTNGWAWQLAAENVANVGPFNNDDEYASQVELTTDETLDLRYAFRFSFDGGLTHTYCDLDDDSNIFELADTGALTVTP